MNVPRRFRAWAAAIVLAGVAAGSTAGHAAVPASMKEQLRRAVLLPEIDLTAGFELTPDSMTAEEDIPDPRAAVQKLTGELTGEPSDAPRQLRIARLLRKAKDANGWRTAVDQAVALYRRRVALQPDDAATLTGLGDALVEANNTAEGESVLREAIRKSPDHWPARCVLAQSLVDQAVAAIFTGSSAPGARNPGGSSKARPAAEGLERARTLNEEALALLNKAVELAPKESRPRALRAWYHSSVAIQAAMTRVATGTETDDAAVARAMISTNSTADLQMATSLAPKDYRLHLAAMWFIVMGEMLGKGPGNRSDRVPWEDLSQSARDRARQHLNVLETLCDEPDPRRSAGALESLALAKMMLMQDPASGGAAARRALRRDPSRPQALDIVVASMVTTDQFEELQSLLEEQVRVRPEPRTQFLLGKVLAKRDRWKESESTLRKAVEAAPREPLLLLAHACVLLHLGGDDGTTAVARAELESVTKLLPTLTDPATHAKLALHTAVTSVILFALEGSVDEARMLLKSITGPNREHPYVKDVLRILGD